MNNEGVLGGCSRLVPKEKKTEITKRVVWVGLACWAVGVDSGPITKINGVTNLLAVVVVFMWSTGSCEPN